MANVQQWSGRETKALRHAMRMSIRDFAEHLGVSDRTVSKWEAGQALVCPRPEMQAALDTALSKAPKDAQARFGAATGQLIDPAETSATTFVVESHKFIPAYVGTDAANELAGLPSFAPHPHEWLAVHSSPLPHPDGQCVLYAFHCGVAVLHLRQRRQFTDLTALAAWRYASYEMDLPWLTRQLRELLQESFPGKAEYVLSVYCLEQPGWRDAGIDVALRLMCMPSVLVNRRPADRPRPVSDLVERTLLADRFDHGDIAAFGLQGVSIGYASWSGLSYYALAPERALSVDELIACELDIQMLWSYCRQVQKEIEDGRDPSTPSQYGWRFLRAAHSRLTAARTRETAQHCMMRQAALETSGLPSRLLQAQAALRESATPAGRVGP